jgi:hypothetical protein
LAALLDEAFAVATTSVEKMPQLRHVLDLLDSTKVSPSIDSHEKVISETLSEHSTLATSFKKIVVAKLNTQMTEVVSRYMQMVMNQRHLPSDSLSQTLVAKNVSTGLVNGLDSAAVAQFLRVRSEFLEYMTANTSALRIRGLQLLVTEIAGKLQTDKVVTAAEGDKLLQTLHDSGRIINSTADGDDQATSLLADCKELFAKLMSHLVTVATDSDDDEQVQRLARLCASLCRATGSDAAKLRFRDAIVSAFDLKQAYKKRGDDVSTTSIEQVLKLKLVLKKFEGDEADVKALTAIVGGDAVDEWIKSMYTKDADSHKTNLVKFTAEVNSLCEDGSWKAAVTAESTWEEINDSASALLRLKGAKIQAGKKALDGV